MQINIPENISTGELALLPNGTAVAILEKIILGKSQTGNPKLTFKYTVTEEMAEPCADGSPTTGAAILDTYSLQPQALFKLATVYKAVTKDKLPHGDFDEVEFTALMQEALCGSEWNLVVEQEIPQGQTEPRSTIKSQTLR